MPKSPPQKKKRQLTPRQQRFVENMVQPTVISNTQAAIDAGYTKKFARSAAAEAYASPYVAAAIEERKREIARHANVTPEMILGATIMRAIANIDDCLDENGRFSIEKARETGAIRFVKSISRTRSKDGGESVRFEMYSAADAQDQLGDYLGLKQLPRENAEKLQRTLEAIRHYLEANPTVDRQQALDLWSRGTGVPVDRLVQELGNAG